MGTVSTHQLSTFTTPVNGTSPIDANQVKGNDNSIKTSYNAHDADTTIHLQSGAVATRPAASTAGQTWLATDSGAVYLYLDNGSAWVEANYLRNTGGTLTGNLVVTGTLDVTGATTLSSTLKVGGITYTFPASQGANQYLKTDGSGNLSWVTFLETLALTDLSDVTITSASSGQFLLYNGTVWVNGTNGSALTTLNASNLSSGTVNTARIAGSYTGITAVGTLTAGAISTGFTAIADTFLATISTAGKVSNSATTATNANTASAIVARDASGNFTAGTITATLTGNADSATKLATARAINGVNFDGTAAITVPAAAGTLTGTTLASNVVTSSLTAVGTLVTGAIGTGFTAIPNSALANSSITLNGTVASLGSSYTLTAAAGTLTGTTLASNVTLSSLTTVGTLSAGAVPASLVTAGTFGAGAYTFPSTISVTGAVTQVGATNANFTADGTGSAAFVYKLSGVSKWTHGLNVNTGSTAWDLYNHTTGTSALSVNYSTNAVTLVGALAITGAFTGATTGTFSSTLAVTGLATFSSKIQVGTTAGVYTSSTYFTDLATLGAVINLARPSDGAYTNSIFSYDTAAGAKNNLGIASRSDIQFVTGGAAGPSVIFASTGAATFSSTLAISGAFTGATTGTFSSTLAVTGNTTIGASGTAFFTVTNTVGTGGTTINALGGPVIGNFKSADSSDTAATRWTFGRDNQSTGDFVWLENSVARGRIITGGGWTLPSTLAVTGAATFSSTLGVTGAATFSAIATFNAVANNNPAYFKGSTTTNQSYGPYIDAGTSSSDYAFSVRDATGASTYFKVRGDGVVTAPTVYSTTVGATNRDLYIDNTGLIGYVSSIRASKTNITPLTDTAWLDALTPVAFNYRKKDESGAYTDEANTPLEYGLIAEEVEGVNTELVFYDETEDGLALRGVSYNKLMIPLLQRVQALTARNDALTARVAALEGV